jgi:ABC-type multidrug transport system fused ATPase/permease subunit
LHVSSGAIEFRNVSFGYLPERPIIKNLSFMVQPGTRVAFVGTSGSGKSTIARLLYRFYDPWEGSILIDGQDIKQAELNSTRKQIGVIPQDTVLFNDTIRYNINYVCVIATQRETSHCWIGDVAVAMRADARVWTIQGRPTASKEEVEQAAKKAQIYELLERVGDNTKVGERGLRLSGGEKQRVAIARAILKDAPILVCDEATSALDSQTECDILESLQLFSDRKTTLMIAHRLSSIMNADEIIVLDHGRCIVSRWWHLCRVWTSEYWCRLMGATQVAL